jgi:hypothetical protein
MLCLLTLSTTGPSPFIFSPFPVRLHHTLHESNEFHDSHNHHGFTNLQASTLIISMDHAEAANPPFRYYQSSQNVTPSATQAVPSPSTGRKRKNNKSGRDVARRKRQQQPAPSITAPCYDYDKFVSYSWFC